MNLVTAAALFVALLDFIIGARYCAMILRRQITPRIATWIIFEIGVAMSLATYLSGPDHSAVKASLNVADTIQVTAIVLAQLFERKGRRIHFTRNERLCLLLAALAAIAWITTRTSWIGFIGFQAVMIIAYAPTLEHLWRWHPTPAPETLQMWGINAVIALIAIVVAVTGRHDYLAMIYPLRAFTLCVAVSVLILRWKHKTKRVTP